LSLSGVRIRFPARVAVAAAAGGVTCALMLVPTGTAAAMDSRGGPHATASHEHRDGHASINTRKRSRDSSSEWDSPSARIPGSDHPPVMAVSPLAPFEKRNFKNALSVREAVEHITGSGDSEGIVITAKDSPFKLSFIHIRFVDNMWMSQEKDSGVAPAILTDDVLDRMQQNSSHVVWTPGNLAITGALNIFNRLQKAGPNATDRDTQREILRRG
jgi:hypothetical protein